MEALKKDLLYHLKRLMIVHGFSQAKYTVKQLEHEVFSNKYTKEQIRETLSVDFNLTPGLSQPFVYIYLGTEPDYPHPWHDVLILFRSTGRPYTFRAQDILSETELSEFKLSKKAEYIGQEPLFNNK